MLMIPMFQKKAISTLVNWINGPNDVKEGKYSLAILFCVISLGGLENYL